MKSEVYVIAEIGVNHNGSLDLALESIDKAKEYIQLVMKNEIVKVEED